MSRGRRDRDLADRLLAGVTRMMPAGRSEWGRAMQAELATIETARRRLSFVAGCARTVVREPSAYRRAGYPLLVAAALAAAGVKASTLTYLPLRVCLVALVGVLAIVSWRGRRPGLLGPVGTSRSAHAMRIAGYLTVAASTIWLLANLGKNPDQAPSAVRTAPFAAVALAVFLIGFLTLTSRRCAADSRVLISGAASGVAAALLWVAVVVLFHPIPTNIVGALLAVGAAMLTAGLVSAHGRASTGRSLLAALAAGVISALLIVQAVVVLSALGPASFIPDLAAPALTAADDLAQSRNEIQDPYVGVAFIGFVLAALLSVTASRAKGAKEPDPLPTMASEGQ